jgi:choline dehydrogenase-like flavoprotein
MENLANICGIFQVFLIKTEVRPIAVGTEGMVIREHKGVDKPMRDVCVVGAGPVGISLAVRLQELGLSVLLLESGGETSDTVVQQLSDAVIEVPRAHDSMQIAISRQLGGTSNLWGGRCLPYDEIDFMDRPGLVDVKWPIGLADIQPYYQRACEFTDSGTANFLASIAGLPEVTGDFRFDALERWSGTPRLQRLHARTLARSPLIDLRLKTVVTGFIFDEGGRVSSVETVRPDGTGRKSLSVRTVVIAAGGVESTRLLLSVQRNHPQWFGGLGGPLGRYYMGHVVGTIAHITFANQIIDAAFTFDVDPNGVYVRRRFVPSKELQLNKGLMNSALWPVVPAVSDPSHGSGPLSAIYLALVCGPVGRLFIPEALRKRHVPPNPGPLTPHVLNVIRDLPATIPYVFDFVAKRYLSKRRIPGFYLRNRRYRYGLFYHSEQWPNPDSRITLTDQTDRLGLPIARIGFHFHERDAASILRTHDAFAGWILSSGLGKIQYQHDPADRSSAILDQAKHGSHQTGTTRMGANERDGVVDGNLRTFSCRNLFVASSSSLPTSSQANPTLTTIALALRLAEKLTVERRAEGPIF